MHSHSYNKHISCLTDGLKNSKKNFGQYDNWNQILFTFYEHGIIKSIIPFQLSLRDKLLMNKKFIQSDIDKDLCNILGAGKGSTPQSDDFFLGFLATICNFEKKNVIFRRNVTILSKYPFEKLTTAKSSILIRKFLMSNYPNEIKRYIELLNEPLDTNVQLSLFNNEIRNVMMIGASSGKYFLLGSLWEIQLQEEIKKE